MSRHTRSRQFLQCTDDNFVTQVVEEQTRRDVLILCGRRKAISRIATLDFRRVNFDFFENLLKYPMS